VKWPVQAIRFEKARAARQARLMSAPNLYKHQRPTREASGSTRKALLSDSEPTHPCLAIEILLTAVSDDIVPLTRLNLDEIEGLLLTGGERQVTATSTSPDTVLQVLFQSCLATAKANRDAVGSYLVIKGSTRA
jgi:hypothetical protein